MIAIAAVLLLAAAEPPRAEEPEATLAAVKAMYDQSCQVKAYGSYDDICSALRKQMRDAEKAARNAPKPAVQPKPAAAPGPVIQAEASPPAAVR